MMIDKDAESAGIFFFKELPPLIATHYSGNFWIARATLLHRTFTKNPNIGKDGTKSPVIYDRHDPSSDYYSTEMFLFRDGLHNFIDLFPMPPGYLIYQHYLPRNEYVLD